MSRCAGKRYDEKVDVFSFGIVLCEVRELPPPPKQIP